VLYHLSQLSPLFLMSGIFEIGSHKLFVWAVFEQWFSCSLPSNFWVARIPGMSHQHLHGKIHFPSQLTFVVFLLIHLFIYFETSSCYITQLALILSSFCLSFRIAVITAVHPASGKLLKQWQWQSPNQTNCIRIYF
jgi:hypothetical protein